jgi:branched-chain amino acid aminotransferase
VKYGDLPGMVPATTSLNYGTTVWEGIKAFRTSKNRCVVFRPERNCARMQNGAQNMLLPIPSYELFMRGVQTAVQANAELIPPYGEGMKLYIRPILIGSGQQLGLSPSAEFSLVFYTAPTGNYFKGASSGLKLNIEKHHARAARGGFGHVKCAGNYGVTLLPLFKAKDAGFSDNIYLELESYQKNLENPLCAREPSFALRNSVIQEMSAANVFLVQKKHGRIMTPALDRKTILPGVTRDSVIAVVKEYGAEIAAAMGLPADQKLEIVETSVHVKDFEDASEAFATGTAAELVAIASVGEYFSAEEVAEQRKKGTEGTQKPYGVNLEHGETSNGPATAKILEILREIMLEKREDKFGWLRDPFESAEKFRAQMSAL